MGSNKTSSHKYDLYRKRLEAIEWFEEYHPDELDFFGYDWDKHIFRGNKLIRAFNRISFLQKLLAKNFKTYKGAYNGFKIPLFEKYKFSICFENAHSIPGWITEKIFHSMFAGCIPVYYGASNIKDHIPDNCYINFNNFKDFKEMYNYMKSITDNEYIKYLDNIQNFIDSEKFYIFTHDYFTKTVTSEILKVMNNE